MDSVSDLKVIKNISIVLVSTQEGAKEPTISKCTLKTKPENRRALKYIERVLSPNHCHCHVNIPVLPGNPEQFHCKNKTKNSVKLFNNDDFHVQP